MISGSLAELEAVVAVAGRGGFRAAARDLGVSSSTVSQSIANLEERLGVRLFNRTTRSVSLSAAGEQFLAEVGPALTAIRDAMEGVDEHRSQPSGTLRINLALGAARAILSPLVLEYMRRHPQMKVELTTEGALVDVIGLGFDAGIRIAEAVPPDMISVKINEQIRSVVVGSPDYFKLRPRPKTPVDLQSHTCIRARLASGAIYHWEFEKRGKAMAIDVPGSLTLDEGELMHRTALEGAGLAFLPEWSVAEDVAEGRLIQVLGDWTPPFPGLCLYYPGRRHVPAKLRAFIDLIRERTLQAKKAR